jgi:hypothetical protein
MRALRGVAQWKCFCKLERETRIEAATFSLQSRRSLGRRRALKLLVEYRPAGHEG